MKKLPTLLLLLLTPLFLLAQKTFHRLSIGAGTGLTQIHGDLKSSQTKRLYTGSAEYYFSPYAAGVLEAQLGTMSGQDISNNRYFSNSYKAGSASLKLYMGQFRARFNNNYLSQTRFSKAIEGIFASAGAGIIKNNQTKIYRQKDNPLFAGANNNKDVFVPLSIGIDNSGFAKRIVAGLRYQYNLVLGDQVDGYSTVGSKNDIFNTFTLSLKYKFGPTRIF